MITYTKYAPREVSDDQTVNRVRIRPEQRCWPISNSPSRGPIEWQGQWRSLQFI
jgi:hypothetical protein